MWSINLMARVFSLLPSLSEKKKMLLIFGDHSRGKWTLDLRFIKYTWLGIIYSETRPVKQDADLFILSLDNLIRKYFLVQI